MTVLADVTYIGKGAFSGCADSFELEVVQGSYVMKYAQENGLKYKAIGAGNDWLSE